MKSGSFFHADRQVDFFNSDVRVQVYKFTNSSIQMPEFNRSFALLSLFQMERECSCGKGLTVRRISASSINRNRAYYACPDSKPKKKDFGCGFFRWENENENELKRPADEKQTAQSSSSSPGPSSAGKGSGGLKANCPNCKVLLVKIKTPEAKLDLARRHEDPSQCAALQKLLVGLDEILLDES